MPKPTLGVLLLLLGCLPAFSQQPPPPAGQAAAGLNPAGTLRQIIPGHYMYSSTTFNSGVIATGEGVVVLEALSSEALARAERQAIASTIGQPVRMLVSSTHHNRWPQYEKLLGYDAQRETAVRRLYRQLTGTLQ